MPPYKLIIFDLDGTLTSLRLSPVHDAPLIVLPNVHAKLTELAKAGITLALATNQMNGDFRGRVYSDAIVEERLKAVADLFPMIPLRCMQVAKPDSPDWKPSPNMLLALLAKTYTDPQEALFVGDAETDQNAARSAGIDFAWAWDFFDWPEGKKNSKIDWKARGDDIWRKS